MNSADEGSPGPNFIEPLSTKICLACNFFLNKNRITNQNFNFLHKLLVTGIQLLFAYAENHVEIFLVILFLSMNFMLSNFLCLAALWNWAQMLSSTRWDPVYLGTKVSFYKRWTVFMKLGPDVQTEEKLPKSCVWKGAILLYKRWFCIQYSINRIFKRKELAYSNQLDFNQ